jgi:glycosyltransferase involved in cell wall biosynthesis
MAATSKGRDGDAVGERRAQKIVMVVGALTCGGAERVATTMANAWAREGREVWLVSTYLGGKVADYSLHRRVSVVFLSEHMRVRSSLRGFAAVRKAFALRSLIRSIAPDAVVSFLTNVNVLTILALVGLRIPLIVSERTDPAGDVDLHRLFRFARGLCYRHADALVVQTSAAAKRWAEKLPGVQRIEIIHNPLPRELDVAGLRARQGVDGGTVIAIGRLAREKGFATLLSAFATAFADDPVWKLDIWGRGLLHADLTRRVAELRLESRARLCGETTQPWTVLAAAQIFVLSSEYEGFPNAMLEAMAVGLPCIAFDCPSGPQELADGGAAAIMVPAGDAQALASTLREVASDRELRRTLGSRAAAYVRREYSEVKVMGDWDRLLGEFLPADRGLIARGEG